MKKFKRMLIIVLSVVLVFGAATAFDAIRAKSFDIEVVSISPEKPVADVKQKVEVTLRLTHHGKGVADHSLFMLPTNGGKMKANRVVTDKDGYAVFTYIPYTETRLQPAKPIKVSVIDESNSVFIEINAKSEFIIDLQSKSGG